MVEKYKRDIRDYFRTGCIWCRIGKYVCCLGLMIAVCIIIASYRYSKENSWLLLVLGSYAIITICVVALLALRGNFSKSISTISFAGFFCWTMYVPIWSVITYSWIQIINDGIIWTIYQRNILENIEQFLVQIKTELLWWYLIAQTIAIIGWFSHKLLIQKVEDTISLMKLDFYSTIAIFPLTIIWVIYKLDDFRLGFAIILGTFMFIQILIKVTQLYCTENKRQRE